MNFAIVLSGGVGNRVGSSIPKQYINVNGVPIISYCLRSFIEHPNIGHIVIVADQSWHDYIRTQLFLNCSKAVDFAEPGKTRQLSIFNGLRKCAEFSSSEQDWVVIHDAARPLVTDKIISDCLEAQKEGYNGSLPVIPVKDTIYQSTNKVDITGLLDRNTLYAGQAPEAFNLSLYLKAHNDIEEDELLRINGSSELAFKMGLKIKLVEGDPNNYKITDPSDLERFKNTIL